MTEGGQHAQKAGPDWPDRPLLGRADRIVAVVDQ
jgi:hypothetical protein